MPQSRRSPRTIAAHFDEHFYAEDLERTSPAGRQAAETARAGYETAGIPMQQLTHCDPEGRDGTRLGGCVKVYLPPPAGRFGMVFGLTVKDGRPRLAYLAHGVRHHPRGSHAQTVYEIAHQRLHGTPPSSQA